MGVWVIVILIALGITLIAVVRVAAVVGTLMRQRDLSGAEVRVTIYDQHSTRKLHK